MCGLLVLVGGLEVIPLDTYLLQGYRPQLAGLEPDLRHGSSGLWWGLILTSMFSLFSGGHLSSCSGCNFSLGTRPLCACSLVAPRDSRMTLEHIPCVTPLLFSLSVTSFWFLEPQHTHSGFRHGSFPNITNSQLAPSLVLLAPTLFSSVKWR